VCRQYPLRAACRLPIALHGKRSKVNKAEHRAGDRKVGYASAEVEVHPAACESCSEATERGFARGRRSLERLASYSTFRARRRASASKYARRLCWRLEKRTFTVWRKSPTEICYKRPLRADKRRLPARLHRKLLRTRLILRTSENEPVRSRLFGGGGSLERTHLRCKFPGTVIFAAISAAGLGRPGTDA
jgi:hypothetical protein